MVSNLYENFLNDPDEYQKSEDFWLNLWSKLDQWSIHQFGWQTAWLGTGGPHIKDGNPIFSAVSPILRRGIRIIQQEPLEPALDLQFWLDTFGGDPTEPTSINEVVISCVLSDVAASYTRRLIAPWVAGDSLSFKAVENGRLEPVTRRSYHRNFLAA